MIRSMILVAFALLLAPVQSARAQETGTDTRPALKAAATRLVGVSGPGAAWRPNSCAIKVRSMRPCPLTDPPPWSSLTRSRNASLSRLLD